MRIEIFHLMLVLILAGNNYSRRTVNAQNCVTEEENPYVDCYCENDYEIVIVCDKTDEQIQHFPVRNRNSNFTTAIKSLRIEGFKFEELPSKAFDGLKIQIIELVNNGMQTIRRDSFQGLSGLKELNIFNNVIRRVEENAFESVKRSLKSMTLPNDETADSILTSTEFPILSKLSLNNLKRLNSKWFNSLRSLENLEIFDSPEISNYPSKGFFTKNSKLTTVHILYSNITNMLPVLKWLHNVKDQLICMSLAYNQIESIPNEIGWFSRLIKLDLSQNNIQTITKKAMRNLNELTELDLFSNRIRSISSDAFKYNKKLEVIDLENNQFEEIHDFLFSESLFQMSYRNQNGHLVELKDYQFDIKTIRNRNSLTVFIDKNSLTKFGHKTFCSRTDTNKVSRIDLLSIDFDSFFRMDHCLLRQFGLRNKNLTSIIDIRNAPPDQNHSQVCNCLNVMFLNQFNIELNFEGCELDWVICAEVTSDNDIANINANCATRNEFTCIYKGK